MDEVKDLFRVETVLGTALTLAFIYLATHGSIAKACAFWVIGSLIISAGWVIAALMDTKASG